MALIIGCDEYTANRNTTHDENRYENEMNEKEDYTPTSVYIGSILLLRQNDTSH